MKKQALLADISLSINKVKNLIRQEKKTMIFSDKEVTHYPLFFSEEVAPDINSECMDSCATTMGLISYKLLNNESEEDKSIVNNAIRGILKMQNQDKSWSSVIYQGQNVNQGKQLDGIICETCFALNALIASSFLDKIYFYDQSVLSEFNINSFADRISFVIESVKWLDCNKQNNGWYYTTTEHFINTNSILPAASSTISVINTLNLIINKLQSTNITMNIDVQQNDIDFVKDLIKNAVDTLFDMQKISGGFSKRRGDSESIAQTSNALIILLQLDATYIKAEYEPKIELSIKWLLSKVKNIYNKEKINNTDFFDEYVQIIIENNQFLKRPIMHETHIDTHIFCALLKISQSEKYLKSISFLDKMKLYYHLKKCLHHILELQTDDGTYSGAFKCRRTTPSEEYPIYSTFQAIIGLKNIQSNFDAFYESYSKFTKYILRILVFLLSIIILIFVIVFTQDIKDIISTIVLEIITNIIAIPLIKKISS